MLTQIVSSTQVFLMFSMARLKFIEGRLGTGEKYNIRSQLESVFTMFNYQFFYFSLFFPFCTFVFLSLCFPIFCHSKYWNHIILYLPNISTVLLYVYLSVFQSYIHALNLIIIPFSYFFYFSISPSLYQHLRPPNSLQELQA